jgi:hypothetical protein
MKAKKKKAEVITSREMRALEVNAEYFGVSSTDGKRWT